MSIIKDNWNIIEEKIIKPMYEDGYFPLTVADEVTRHLQEPTAIEFLRKAKAICQNNSLCNTCLIKNECSNNFISAHEADLVRKVMDYQIKEVSE